jgi:hypothetical protein
MRCAVAVITVCVLSWKGRRSARVLVVCGRKIRR